MTPLEIRDTIKRAEDLLHSVRFYLTTLDATRNEMFDIKSAVQDAMIQAKEVLNTVKNELHEGAEPIKSVDVIEAAINKVMESK